MLKFQQNEGAPTFFTRAPQDRKSPVSVTIALETPRQDGVLRLLDMSDAYAQSLYPPESNHLVDVSTLEKPTAGYSPRVYSP